MDIRELEKLMVDGAVTIRAIPKEVVGIYELRHRDQFPNAEVFFDVVAGREMLRDVTIPKNAGKFIILKKCGMGSIVRFDKPVFYDSIEEAIRNI